MGLGLKFNPTNQPSLVCDLQEPYRPLIDGFLVTYSKQVEKKDIEANYKRKKPRLFLKHKESSKLIVGLNSLLDIEIEKQRSRQFENNLKVRTVVKRDVEGLANSIRKDYRKWHPTNLFKIFTHNNYDL